MLQICFIAIRHTTHTLDMFLFCSLPLARSLARKVSQSVAVPIESASKKPPNLCQFKSLKTQWTPRGFNLFILIQFMCRYFKFSEGTGRVERWKRNLRTFHTNFQANFIPNKLPMRAHKQNMCESGWESGMRCDIFRTTMILTSIIWNQIQFDASMSVSECVSVCSESITLWRLYVLCMFVWMCHFKLPSLKTTRVKSVRTHVCMCELWASRCSFSH